MEKNYSRLRAFLAEQRLSFAELRSRLNQLGVAVDPADLHMLRTRYLPLSADGLAALDAVARAVGVSRANLVTTTPPRRPKGVIVRFPAEKQSRMDELLRRNATGSLLADERGELERLVRDAEELSLANARRVAADVAAREAEARGRFVAKEANSD